MRLGDRDSLTTVLVVAVAPSEVQSIFGHFRMAADSTRAGPAARMTRASYSALEWLDDYRSTPNRKRSAPVWTNTLQEALRP